MKYRYILVGVVLCIVIEVLLYKINHKFNFFTPIFSVTGSSYRESRENDGILTNPLLECSGVDADESVNELNISKSELTQYADGLKKKFGATSVSVYVRDLNNGPWFSIDGDEKFIGASLLKIPVLIAYMRKAEMDPSILNSSFEYNKVLDSDVQYYKPSKEIQLGQKYTVNDLLNYMIINSDNNAAIYLASSLTDNEIKNVFSSVGLDSPVYSTEYPVTTRSYAGFFRVLYNSSYLTKDYSEKALEILTKTDFREGLRKYIPSNILIANKFGIREDQNLKQLHDCGIVYYPKHPYLICVMTKGDNFPNLSSVISNISKFVFDKVDAINK